MPTQVFEMTDNDFLQWIYNRMVEVHNENELYDYMHKFKGIIEKNKMTEKDKNQTVRLCCDCKYYRKDWYARITGYGNSFDMCFNAILNEADIVTGESKGRFCDTMRKFHGCGMEAKYFEAK